MKTYEGIEAAWRFVELFDGCLENDKACWRTYPDRAKEGGKNYEGTFEDVLPALKKQETLGASAFRVINLGGQNDASITEVMAFFIDKDGGDLPDWHLPPTFTCNRGDHVHAYWV
ncbi:MAG: hypothetical protein OEO83_15555, partial [Alphaproteobacteria bacterium]|nr:hypothetical protein [Alphaproteobacteria bacterium]